MDAQTYSNPYCMYSYANLYLVLIQKLYFDIISVERLKIMFLIDSKTVFYHQIYLRMSDSIYLISMRAHDLSVQNVFNTSDFK